MKVSVVMTTYNRAHVIENAVDAILAQTRPVDEIIVWDDGSTDGTGSLLRFRYGKQVTIIEQDNIGCQAARAKASHLASGDWIAYCDTDDQWHPDHIERLVQLAELAPSANLLFSNFAETGPTATNADKFATMSAAFWQGSVELGGGFVDLGDNSLLRLLAENPAFPSAMMVRKTTHDTLGGIDERLSYILSSDADLTRRLAIVGGVACDRRITVDILKNGENISANDIHTGMGRIRVLKQNQRDGGIFRPYEEEIRQAISDTACTVMMAAFWHRDMETFRTAAAEVHFRDRPLPLKVRSVIARMPAFARNLLLGLYPRTS